MWIAPGSGLQHLSLLMAANTSLAFLNLPLPTCALSKAKERQTWPPLRLVQWPTLWIRNGQNDVQIFFFSLVFRNINYLFLSSSSFNHLILVYFSAIQCHLENATRTVNSYITVHFLSSKFINLKALLSKWHQLHFCSDLVLFQRVKKYTLELTLSKELYM